jgi:hypothetical protein
VEEPEALAVALAGAFEAERPTLLHVPGA